MKVYKAEDELAGRKSECKECGALVMIPERPITEVLYGISVPSEDTVPVEPEPPPQRTAGSESEVREDETRPGTTSERRRAGKYCHACGVQIRQESVACPSCGVRQSSPARPRRREERDRYSDVERRGDQWDGYSRGRDGGINRLSGEQLVAGILAILVGSLGIHKFYLGFQRAGITMLVVSIVTIPFALLGMIVMTVIDIIEGVMCLTKSEAQFRREYIRGRKEWF
jgi:TM2 domain-containing membrane protein YozV/DNA-directed RNA polymerase subunit RPC12/RpoP